MTSRSPTVSVVLPTYNRASVLDRSIESVLEQTYEDLELIVVDDGSTDGTSEVVAARTDPRLRYIEFDENRGANVARNAGIEAAVGDYIGFQDSDDRWYPEKLEAQLAAFADVSESVGVVYTGCWQRWGDDRAYFPPSDRERRSGDLHRPLLAGNFVTLPVTLLRRECFEAVGRFDETLPRFQDWELWLRLSQAYEFAFVDRPLAEKHMHSDPVSIGNDIEAYIAGKGHIVEKHRDLLAADERALSTHLFDLGHKCLLNGRAREGRRRLLQALRWSPQPVHVLAAIACLFGSGPYRVLADRFELLRS